MGALFEGPLGSTALHRLSGGEAAEVEGESAQNIARFNAEVQRREAEAARRKGRFEQKRQAEKATRTQSALTAKVAAAGGLGSPVAGDIAAEQAAESELEKILIGIEAETAARRAESQADVDILSGKFARQRGKNLALQRNVEFGAKILAGFA